MRRFVSDWMLAATAAEIGLALADVLTGRAVVLTVSYLVPALGAVEVNGVRLDARDGAAITGETGLEIRALEDAEVVLVDAA